MSENRDPNQLICFCMTVTRGEITEAIGLGFDSAEKLKQEVGCCTGCGTCIGRVENILAEADLDSEAQKIA